MLSRVSSTQSRKRKSESVHRNQESSAPKRLKGNPAHNIELNSISVTGIPPRHETSDSVETQPFQPELPQMDWSQIDWNNLSIEASQTLGEYAPIFGDGTIPPVYSATSYSNMASTGALSEYAPIFEDGTIPPLYPPPSHSNMAPTGALSEYAPIFEDGSIPPLCPPSCLNIAFTGTPSEDEVVRSDPREIEAQIRQCLAAGAC